MTKIKKDKNVLVPSDNSVSKFNKIVQGNLYYQILYYFEFMK